MNDPWDVKSVRHAGQYMSCMKINGVPLLPPLLSKECRKEMQYYKLLAKEVEKRISLLKQYVVESDSDASEDKTDAPELPESEQSYELPKDEVQAGFNVNIDKITAITTDKSSKNLADSSKAFAIGDYNNLTSNVTVKQSTKNTESPALSNSPTFVFDLSLSINETGRNVLETLQKTPIELPERDYDSSKKTIQNDCVENQEPVEKIKTKDSPDNVNSPSLHKETLSDPLPDLPINQDGPSSLSSKSFTGSLNDIHTDSMKESQIVPTLIRQRSYTLLKPSPQLLAHLEVQSLSTGVEMHSISMSESMSNLSSPNKKRRSWDLETAKVKWSSMALELSNKNVTNASKSNINKSTVPKTITKKPSPDIPPAGPRARSVTQERPCRASLSAKTPPKSEPIQKTLKRSQSPVRNANSLPNRINGKDTASPKTNGQKKEAISPKAICDSEDPASRVRELYEKIHKQQLIQMASLVEKQKREQMLLQQVFEEQNNLLYKQLKTICPKSPIEIKEAWGEKEPDTVDRGPVSLSQLINSKSSEESPYDSPVSTTLTDTNNYLNHCEKVLKKSRDITGSIKKQSHARSQNGGRSDSPKAQGEGSKTRTHSPVNRNTSRRLDYDTSASSDRDFEPILTDRTNDTLADLNVTFPSDFSDEYRSTKHNGVIHHQMPSKDLAMVHRNTTPNGAVSGRSAESSIRSMEQTIYNSMNNLGRRQVKTQIFNMQPTAQERAAATKIVAHAKGYLVRRLMRTERVQATVQTIRDALLCALQLHQDREGIRGADVDLHRRLIQQITAACYSLHDTFVASSPAERCAVIAADRGRRRSLAAKQTTPRPHRSADIMSQSHSGSFPARAKRPSASLMTQSNYETFSGDKWCMATRRSMPSPRRRPWR